MILITTATQTEAKTLIDFFKLKNINKRPFLTYQNSQIFLVVTNIGKLNCISAISFFFGKFLDAKIIGAINIGIAGHKKAPIGDIFLIHKVQDNSTGQIIFPSIPFKWKGKTDALTTYAKPNLDYSVNTLMDMEGFGFYFASLKFLKIDIIHSLKIVSDNQNFPANKIEKNKVIRLIENQLIMLQELITKLLNLNTVLPSICMVDIAPYFKFVHFSETEKIQLIDLLKRINLLGLKFNASKLIKLNNSRKIINALRELISNGYHLH